jgi:NTE family protein
MTKKIALVLSGGGARGMAHIGVIEELERQGYEISSIAGTSMGALVGGIYALGKMEELKNWLYTLDKLKVFHLVDFTFSGHGLIKGDRVLNTMKEMIADKNIEELNIPFVAVATDVLNKKEKVFTTGSVYDAIRASIAIPTVFTPVRTTNAVLVDGGVMNNIPINHVQRISGDLLVAVDVNANVPVRILETTPIQQEEKQSTYLDRIRSFRDHLLEQDEQSSQEKMGYFDLMDNTFSLMMHQMSQMMLDYYSPDLLVNVSRDTCTTFDFFKAEELVETGRQAAIESIEASKKQKLGKALKSKS